jgi:hypothetical protein
MARAAKKLQSLTLAGDRVDKLRLEGKRYVVETVASSGRVRPKGFASLSLDLTDLWRSIDER